MKRSSSSPLTNEMTTLPIARIDTMDVPYVLPLREYFHTNGCQVFVNTGPTENVTYYLIVGDDDFVKRTLAFRHDFGKKQYVVCWSVHDKEELYRFFSSKTKVAFIDPKPLDVTVLQHLFSFFFLSKKKEIDITTSHDKNVPEQHPSPNIILPSIKNVKKEENISTNEQEAKKRIKETIADVFDMPQKTENKKQTSNKAKTSQGFYKKDLVILCIFLFTLIIAPWVLFITAFGMRSWSLVSGANCLKTGNTRCMQKEVKRQDLWKTYETLPLPIISFFLSSLGKENHVQTIERAIFFSDTISSIEKEAITITNSASDLALSFFKGENPSSSPIVAVDTIRKSIPIIKTQLDIAYTTLTMIQKENPYLSTIPLVRKGIETVEAKLTTFRQMGDMGEQIAQIYPYFSGFKNPQHIVVALQNNSELRPTGGFIGSLMRLTIQDGAIDHMRVEDVYTLDGQLKGHVDPPYPIQTILSQEHWYLRDSNWDPDFSKTGAMIRWFYEKESGEQIDTVIGVTASLLVKMLTIFGPVDLPQYSDTITAENFYAKSLYYIHTNFFPGSTNKKDFLGSLLEAILVKVQKNKTSAGLLLLTTISDALSSKDIQWYTVRNDGQSILERFGWAGLLPARNTCAVISDKSPCLFSFLHINEANLGVNKANVFIARSQTRTIAIKETGEIEETVTRKIRNTASAEIGAGDYVAYLRFFIPETVTDIAVTLDHKAIPKRDTKAKSPSLPYMDTANEDNGLTSIATALIIPPGKEHVITFSYTHTTPLAFGAHGAIFNPFEQKQAGVDAVENTTVIQYPESWDATIITGSEDHMVANRGKLEYNSTLGKDSEYTIQFTR